MRTLLLLISAAVTLAGCEKDSGRPAAGSAARMAPIVIVTKSEITYNGQRAESAQPHLVAEMLDGGAAEPTCGDVMEHLNSALFAYDPKYLALAGTYAGRVLASCHEDRWPEDLKRCIVTASPRALLDHACDKHVSDELARKVLARVSPGQDISPGDFLHR